MAGLSRNKGKAGEREIARILTELTGHEVRSRVRQHDGDDDLVGVPGWSIEAKRYKAAPPALAGAVVGAGRGAEPPHQCTARAVLSGRPGRVARRVACWPAHDAQAAPAIAPL